jgi:hypothetical protein
MVPLVAAAISERYFYEIPHEGESELKAHLDLALGTVFIGKADAGYLFQAEVILENEKLVPDFDYDVEGRTGMLHVELDTGKDEGKKVNIPDLSSVKSSEWNLYFGDEVPIDLDFDLGAAKAELDLTDIPMRTLKVDLGASKAEMYFKNPNPVEMEVLSIEAGASEFVIGGLANARAKHITFDGGMGRFVLDFTGDLDLPRGGSADMDIGMASLEVVIPDDAPVVLSVPDTWLCSVEVPDGFVKRKKGLWYSSTVENRNVDEAFEFSVEAGMGKVRFITD